ncbi:lipoprotein signal peptidase [Alphaproteobacteria bacterium]|nr:lipoprotein signal peptidase [Alphaproteobacteria bacterium]
MPKVPECFSSVKWTVIWSLFILFSDQISKQLAETYLRGRRSLEILPFFDLMLVRNFGVSFGAFNTVPPIILTLLSVAIVIYLVIWARSNVSCRLPSGFVVSGAIGNILDRVFRGSVIDFLDFHVCGYHWPAFNIADSFIVIGAMLLFFVSYKNNLQLK